MLILLSMKIVEKALRIYDDFVLCERCLGRMFSLLGTHTTNLDRGRALLLSMTLENHGQYLSGDVQMRTEARALLTKLAERAKFIPAQEVLKREGFDYSEKILEEPCHLCQGLFESLEDHVELAKETVKDIEFHNLLVGCSPDAEIINREDKFKAKFNLLESESFKSHFNREMGKILSEELGKPPEFDLPEIVFIFSIHDKQLSLETRIRSVFIYGRYNKLIRGIPQTKWICRNCQGAGCEQCNQTGKNYQTSVEELISPIFVEKSGASDSKFHGAGREDVDVRMLGTGRPFVVELQDPRKRSLNLGEIQQELNKAHEGKVRVSDLRFSEKDEVIALKADAEDTKKVYKALVESEEALDEAQFKEKLEEMKRVLEDEIIEQRTTHRVDHRRADLIRRKKIYSIEGTYLRPNRFEFTIETQGGTYIKELINGDQGRTNPSLAGILGTPATCKQLDVLAIKH